MKTLAYYNGKLGEADEITVPFNDRSHWFGDGVYDAGPSRNYKMFAIDEHIERFFNSAALMDIVIPKSKDEIRDLLEELVKKMDTGDNFVYIECTRGGFGMRGHVYDKVPGNLWVMMMPQKVCEGLSPIKLITVEDTRFYHCNCKTLNLLPSVLAAEEAKRKGSDETILYSPGGRVTECAHSNCHIIKDGKLFTAPTDELILPGIARAHMIRMAKKLGYGVSETPYNLKDVFEAEEVLVSSSSNPCLHACELDGKPVGGKNPEMLEDLRKHLVEELYEATE
ncbi:MAG: aminotransferase class IV [Lachnospiraceae bacterium]|nr:aminotransferase class IV [Lachnospiraceae bacterium]